MLFRSGEQRQPEARPRAGEQQAHGAGKAARARARLRAATATARSSRQRRPRARGAGEDAAAWQGGEQREVAGARRACGAAWTSGSTLRALPTPQQPLRVSPPLPLPVTPVPLLLRARPPCATAAPVASRSASRLGMWSAALSPLSLTYEERWLQRRPSTVPSPHNREGREGFWVVWPIPYAFPFSLFDLRFAALRFDPL